MVLASLAMQDVSEEARVAAGQAMELRNEVHRYESGQPSAASGKTSEHANIPRLKKQAARASDKAKREQESARAESKNIKQRMDSVAVSTICML